MAKNETLIMTHSDTDGMCAGALLLARYPDSDVYFTKPVSFLRDLHEAVKRHGLKKIFVADIALTKSRAAETVNFMSRMKQHIGYFDHHVVPRSVTLDDVAASVTEYVRDGRASASELVYRRFQKTLPRERVWLALYGAIGDYTDDTPFVEERIINWDRRALYFEVSTIVMGIKDDKFSRYDAKRRIIEGMARGNHPSEMGGLLNAAKRSVRREFELYDVVKKQAKPFGSVGYFLDDKHFGFRGPAALFAATVTNRLVGLSVHEIRDHIDITARARDNGNGVKLNILMEKAAENVGGSGGGHPSAAGARIPEGTLEKFLKNVDLMVKG